ncbi:B12-binding domain-containing radical SAM protein [Tichowtungia aerotolerans]|uniref:Radical SAM protein n=1 Tax=Tichowtungia aerotolerans TaxID=2697043 RepID=A0A6P1M935_9BACT|nr:B12-binding domain-containing radical SAM protein [Tichowtungia aerotolerans]QHI70401.1 radical SAM protein [Tichowtungia aerotolerans]
MKILLITPPLLQPNTPYAATPLLTAWLRSQGHDAVQADLSLELLLKLFSKEGLCELFQRLESAASGQRSAATGFLEQRAAYLETIEPVVAFLQGKSDSLNVALPEGPNLARAYDQEEQLQWDFRGLNGEDRARHLCSLYLDDIAEAFKLADPNFGFSRYAESQCAAAVGFKDVLNVVTQKSMFRGKLESLADRYIEQHAPDLVVLTVPFPGCLAGAIMTARRMKQIQPEVNVVLGGGYVNTELRELADPQVFDFVDFVCLDSGMIPLLRLVNGETPVRTFVREGGAVRFYEDDDTVVPHDSLPAPVLDGLPLNDCFGLFEVLNPVTRLWSDGRWNKLVLAQGCCWSRCAFCDTSIDYICRYDPASPKTICDWMESMMAESGSNGFHFVDEALPPDLLDGLCSEILKRGLNVEWWGNIRFEKRLGEELVRKMAHAGCIAVTGGLETCSDRTLKLMRKGITVEDASQVLRNFADAGILTHAYLMYGFPTQTRDEVFQGLETVRGLMEEGALHSVYWHRFALTAHSEMAREPDRFEIRLLPEVRTGFARNEVPFAGNFDHNLEAVGDALRAASYNFNLGLGFDLPVEEWFVH